MSYTPQELTAVLQKYKAGKQSLERRVIAAENWWKLRNRFEEDKRPGASSAGDFRAVSGWLHNVIVSKHADAMEAYPEPVILPREPDDRAEAELLSAVVPCILEQNAFERTWSDAMWQKLKTGTAAYRVGWDPDKLGGLGDISIERVDLLNLFWEPGIADIQRSKFVFCTHLEDNDELEEEFPQLRGRLRGNPFTATRFLYDDAVSLDGKSTVVEAYYRRKRAGRTVLHYVKYVGDIVLYSTEEGEGDTTVGDGLCAVPQTSRLTSGDKSAHILQSTCHSETSPQTGRGNPRPLSPHINTVSTQGEADCHVGLCPPRNDGGGRKPVAPISAAQNVENGAPTNQSCHSETSSQTGRGNPHPPSPSPPLLRAHFARLCAEADALHRADPGFDLDSALRDPAFVRLTAPDVGVPVADAWYALHRREYAETLRRESLEQAAAAVASGSLRPREGGRASGGELLGTDPRHMTAAQRAELRDRIKRGERVYPR